MSWKCNCQLCTSKPQDAIISLAVQESHTLGSPACRLQSHAVAKSENGWAFPHRVTASTSSSYLLVDFRRPLSALINVTMTGACRRLRGQTSSAGWQMEVASAPSLGPCSRPRSYRTTRTWPFKSMPGCCTRATRQSSGRNRPNYSGNTVTCQLPGVALLRASLSRAPEHH